MVIISVCHTEDRGSIPRTCDFYLFIYCEYVYCCVAAYTLRVAHSIFLDSREFKGALGDVYFVFGTVGFMYPTFRRSIVVAITENFFIVCQYTS